jgi:hypothetical protein
MILILLNPLRFWLVKDLNEYSAPVPVDTRLPHTKTICTDFEINAHGADDPPKAD